MHGCHSHPHGGDSKDRQEAPAPTVLPDVLSGLRTFLQQDQRSFLPFFPSPVSPAAGVHTWLCIAGAADCGQKFPFHHFLHQILPGGFSALGIPATTLPAPHGKVPVLLLCSASVPLSWETSGHISLLFWGRHSQLDLLWGSTPQVMPLDHQHHDLVFPEPFR